VELEQLSACDALIAELTQGLVLFESAITNARASFSKAKQTLHNKEIADGWDFPPTDACLGDLIAETAALIDRTALSLEKQRLALHRLNSEEASLEPQSITGMLEDRP
jgi:hypothetical protein